MDQRALREFVVDAHRNGYAAGNGDPTGDGGTVVEYVTGNWRYVDRYYGSTAFLGSEIVFFDETPVWGMHYAGEPTGYDGDDEHIYKFLREALEQAPVEMPYRGPRRYAADSFVYRTVSDGTITRFSGTERIDCEGVPVYRGRFGGGRIE
ncbi:hypothetical protein C482_08256 [Natrialba chahannaoensis JCM 10990]|uniref:DUF5680 domain-containing protein n=1 Tax=Natrialba chahannaoensis JCM 10990 TaxID=1227492 RepID=M0AR36_9EURY|nr:DUF5680 domain-containing protein [Natrialba chahannaoensis]ELZ01176.1 hypothetical protein C482_08256 [Natrialba chahannaoensis JCM 10990]